PTIVLVARMLWDKGVGEFVQAARKLHLNKVKARFILVGAPDNSNPASISEAQLKAWNDEGVVEWIGHQKNIPTVLSSSHIVCLPSYREGLPKSLLEGLAAGRPIVTTDVTGCREVVRNGENGILVPSHNSSALADALLLLITTPDLRLTYGARGRERAESEFDSKIVVSATLCLYQSFN
ncbi:MAG TPA: glycosyltransferase, partial [Flavobacterium sp.]|nr:glycosyltransferase [Flavobacterium sp.]